MQEPTLAETPPPADAEPRRRRAWLPRVVAVVVLAGAGLAVTRLTFGGEPSAAEKTAAISTELKQKMTTALENLPAEGHQGHGGVAGAEAKMICAARVYGYEPEQAKSVAEVQTVYGFHMCAAAEPKMTWFYAPKLVAPVVMRPNTNPPGLTMAQSTPNQTYQESLKELMPARYQQVAMEGALDPGDMQDLQKRFEKAAG